MSGKKKIEGMLTGLLGGTFDPVHLGHLSLAQKVIEHYDFENFYFVPTQINPLKPKPAKASATDRLHMLQLAVKECGISQIQILDYELQRKGPSYTIDTIDYVKSKGMNPVFIMGNEVFQSLPQWHEPKRLLQSTDIVVVIREPETKWEPALILRATGISDIKACNNRVEHTQGKHWVERLNFEVLPYSATELRQQIKAKTIDFQAIPPGIQREVWKYIKENQIYAEK